MKKTIRVVDTDVFIEGSGDQTIVMIPGWPDTHESWQQQVEFFREDYTCVSFSLPGFAKGDHSNHSLNDIVQRIKEIIDAVSPTDKVILLTHDWGCVFGNEYAMRHSERIDKMIGMDVGDIDSEPLQKSLNLVQKLMIFIYQIILALGFIGGEKIGTGVGKFVATVLGAKSNKENIHRGMSMPYAMRWLGVNGGLENLLPMEPSFPFYYAYATQKPMMFHSQEWTQQLLQQPGNKVQSFDCGHWIMIEQADAFNASLEQWLNDQ